MKASKKSSRATVAQNTITKHTLFVGLNDKDTKKQKIDDATAQAIILQACRACGYDCTLSRCVGVYTHNDAMQPVTIVENTIKIEILFADDDKTLWLCNQLKFLLNQESIALQREQITSELI